jgi:arylsulfatase A-like enzyme
MRVRDELLAGLPREEPWVRRELAAYFAMVSHLDAQVGRVMAALRESGKGDETVVIFAADNGLALGSHGLLGKQNLYEHSVRVPLVVRGPGVAAGASSDGLCYLLDLFPTVCKWTGVAAPANDGRSLLPAVRGGNDAVRDGLLLAYRDVQRAYSDVQFKLIEYRVGGEARTQLFDLAHDPHETRDLSGDARHAGRLADMRRKLRDAQRAAGDPQGR